MRLGVAIFVLGFPTAGSAGECSATSGAQRIPVLELYTSEGCDSCPPADRWVSGLTARGLTPDRVVTLAFHVDYWNYLGWRDPYARAEFSERQRAAARRNDLRFIYTPQLLLSGRDYRRGVLRDDIRERIAAINREQPGATIRITRRDGADGVVTASGEANLLHPGQRGGALAFLALYQNGLATEVLRGENRGRRLEHDFVVRELAGPYPLDATGAARFKHEFRPERSWRREQIHLAAFIQMQTSGEVLQALAVGACPGP